ncbi:hypothetical protein [Planococcus sp. YIM B11945]|uniref:hypothetical protein n=1 Tax=Planococcus sp. YIM B11945 TaxID=3435410 RepID=UPI003D7E6A64
MCALDRKQPLGFIVETSHGKWFIGARSKMILASNYTANAMQSVDLPGKPGLVVS